MTQKTILKVKKEKTKFTQIQNRTLRDKNLSWKAKGLLTYLIGKPDNWKVVLENLTKKGKDGKTSVRSGIKELENNSYMQRKKIRDKEGKIIEHQWTVYESKDLNPEYKKKKKKRKRKKKSEGRKPTTGKPRSGEQETTNKDNTNTDNNIKKNKHSNVYSAKIGTRDTSKKRKKTLDDLLETSSLSDNLFTSLLSTLNLKRSKNNLYGLEKVKDDYSNLDLVSEAQKMISWYQRNTDYNDPPKPIYALRSWLEKANSVNEGGEKKKGLWRQVEDGDLNYEDLNKAQFRSISRNFWSKNKMTDRTMPIEELAKLLDIEFEELQDLLTKESELPSGTILKEIPLKDNKVLTQWIDDGKITKEETEKLAYG